MAPVAVDVDALVRRYIDHLRERIPVEAAYLFGSYAQGTATPESDIDVAVVSSAFGADFQRDLTALASARPDECAMIAALPFTVTEHRSPPRGSLLREITARGRRIA